MSDEDGNGKFVVYSITTNPISEDMGFVGTFTTTPVAPEGEPAADDDNVVVFGASNYLMRVTDNDLSFHQEHNDPLHNQPRLNHNQRHWPNSQHHTIHSTSNVLPRSKRPSIHSISINIKSPLLSFYFFF